MVEVQVAKHARNPRQCIHAWIDTAFDGYLVMPKSEIERLELSVLADLRINFREGFCSIS
jgi:predicted aspartyl protease